jgi:hypothetical protein
LDSAVATEAALPLMVPSAQVDTAALAAYVRLLASVGELPRAIAVGPIVWRGAGR